MEPMAPEFFDGIVAEYDSLVHRAVPHYEGMLERLLDYLPAEAGRVLELGCGTGNLSVRLAERYPRAELTIVDGSPEMLAATGRRFEALKPACRACRRYVHARFEELELEPESFDVVTSSMSLHHVLDKDRLFGVVRGFLPTGGRLIFADMLRAGNDELHDVHIERWLEFCRADGNCTEEEVEHLLEHQRTHDHYETLEAHFGILSRAGFRDVDCLWRYGMWTILAATAA